MSSDTGRGRGDTVGGRGRSILPPRMRQFYASRSISSPPQNTPLSESSSSGGSIGISASVHGLSLDMTAATPETRSESAAPTPTPRDALGHRKRVTITEDGWLLPAHEVPTWITKTFHRTIDDEGYAWCFVSQTRRKDFRKSFIGTR